MTTYIYGWTGEKTPDSPQYGRDQNGWWAKETIVLTGTNDPGEVYDTLGESDSNGSSPIPAFMAVHPLYASLRCVDVDVAPLGVKSKCRMQISYRQFLEMNSKLETWRWSNGTQSQRVTSVVNGSYCAHFPPQEDKGLAINMKEDGKAEGTDVLQPRATMTVTKLWAAATWRSISGWYQRVIQSMVATTNAHGWQGYYPGELLFAGFEIEPHPYGRRIEYNFMVAPYFMDSMSRTYLLESGYWSVGSYPWDYIWMEPAYSLNTGYDGRPVVSSVPRSLHIAQVYEESDFSQLGLAGGA